MIKKLFKYGNSRALVIDKAILELININEDTELQLSTDGESLIITPIRKGRRRTKFTSADRKLQRIFEEVLKKYDKDLEKLAKE